jgi:hypothetical protein
LALYVHFLIILLELLDELDADDVLHQAFELPQPFEVLTVVVFVVVVFVVVTFGLGFTIGILKSG